MDQRKYLILSLLALLAGLFSWAIHGQAKAEAWPAPPKQYKYRVGVDIADRQSQKRYEDNCELLSDTAVAIDQVSRQLSNSQTKQENSANDISIGTLTNSYNNIFTIISNNAYLAEQQELREDLQQLIDYQQQLKAFNQHLFAEFEIEYGFDLNSSYGVAVQYIIDRKFVSIKASSDRFAKKNQHAYQINLFTKQVLFKNSNWIFTAKPTISLSNLSFKHPINYVELKILLGYAHTNKQKNYTTFSELAVIPRHYHQANNQSWGMSFLEGVSLPDGWQISNYNECQFYPNFDSLLKVTLYNQVSLSKAISFNKTPEHNIVIQIGYFWKTNIANEKFITSGPTFSLCIDI